MTEKNELKIGGQQHTYVCPVHGDQTGLAMHIQVFAKNFHKVFCVECMASKFEEIGIQEMTGK